MAAASVQAAQPVTVTFEDIFDKPMNHDLLPAFTWRGIQFSGGGLHRNTGPQVTWYEARNRSAVEMIFPAGSTDISFDVDGYGSSIRFEQMSLQVWHGEVDSGTVVATLPIPSPITAFFPPKHQVTVPGPASTITIFTASPPSGISLYTNRIIVDNIRYTLPDLEPAISFDAVLPAHARVLTHNYGAYPYPSPLQTQDGAIRVQATVLIDNQPAPGKTVHFRLIDPPDTAPYVRQAGDDKLDDNFDGPGSLGTPGQTTATAVSDAAGRVAVTLHSTSFASGDNYQIEASGNASFSCGSSCAKSAVYTAWKRVYVEYNKMFRRGAFLSQDVPAGAKEIPVDDVRDLPAPPFEIRLLHAARVDAPAADFITSERVTVVDMKKDKTGFLNMFSGDPEPGRLILDADPAISGLQRTYSGPENINGDRRAYLADAVGVVTGNRSADFLLASCALINSLFDRAFAEYVWLTDATAPDSDLLLTQPRLPYDGVLPRKLTVGGADLDQWQREWLTRKWLRHAARQGIDRVAESNHQALFTIGSFWKSSTSNLTTSYGQTTVASNFNDSWLPVIAIGNQAVVAESVVHELGHQWLVNHGTPNPNAGGGHCGHRGLNTALLMSAESSRLCTMTTDLYQFLEASDGQVGFHYKKFSGVADSEYLRIRRRLDPVPQNEQKPRETPQ